MANRHQRRTVARQARHNQAEAPPPANLSDAVAGQLSQAVACHQRGDATAARTFYLQVLDAAPDNIDAHNLLGVLLHQTGDLDTAAQHAERAVSLHPPSPELHYNLGNIRRDQHMLDAAAACFRKAQDLDPNYVDAIFNLAVILQHLGQVDSAIGHLERALQLRPDMPIGHCLLADMRLGRAEHQQAIAGYRRALNSSPDFAEAHNNLAVALRHIGDDATARWHLEQAVAAKPDYVDAHINLALLCQANDPDAAARHFTIARDCVPRDPRPHLGLAGLHHNLGHFDDALAAYDAGLAAVPGDPALLNNAGSLYRDIGRPADAIAAYQTALAANSEFIEARLNLAHALRDRGDLKAAIEAYRVVLETAPSDEAFNGLVAALGKINVAALDPVELHALAAVCFASNAVRHDDIAFIAGNLVRQQLGPDWTPGERSLSDLATDPVAMGLLERAINVDAGLEQILTTARQFLFDLPDPSPAALRVMAALAMQGHNNAYAFATTPAEDAAVTARVDTLRGAPGIAQILSVAMYRPLPEVDLPDHPAPWWRQFTDHAIAAPAAERALAPAIPTLDAAAGAADATSRQVQDQYETDPYPRWQSLRGETPAPFARRMALINPAVVADTAVDDILIAGCGTGQQPIQVARANPQAQVLAIDLSRRSLAYAARMADRYNVENIRFIQGDILDLDTLDRCFPVIECVGVLHHMADPATGIAALCDRLLPGGFLRLGLYSKSARRHVIAAQQLTRSIQPTPTNIRAFRQQVLADPERPAGHPARIADFYDLSGCRDLLFHVQERNYLLPEVADLLADAGLDFVGFDFADRSVHAAFRAAHPAPGAATDLNAWAAFEAANPATFTAMYQFWCRKA